MGVEEAWVVAPALRDAMRLTLAASEFLEPRQRRPELVDRVSCNREESWLIVDGASWELRFEHSRGLTMVTAKYPSEEALRAAIQSWGPSDIGARWDFWFDDKGTMLCFSLQTGRGSQGAAGGGHTDRFYQTTFFPDCFFPD